MSYVASGGEFNRDTNYITTRITADGRDGYPVEPDRYRLIVARACPWANRTIIVRRLLGLEDVLSIGFCGPTHDERSWTFDLDPGGVDPVLKIPRLRDAYNKRVPDYPKGITVPRSSTCRRVRSSPTTSRRSRWTSRPSGPSSTDRARRSCTPRRYAARSTRSPSASTPRSTTASTAAGSPVRRRPTTRPTTGCSPRSTGSPNGLTRQRYLVGDTITEADVRLFTTLARFDPVYHGHFKCNRQKLDEMPVLWAYARDLFQTPGFGDTIDFVQIKQHYYIVHNDINPTQVVPKGPELSNWLTPARPGSVGRQAIWRRHATRADAGGRTRARWSLRLAPHRRDRPFRVRHGELVALPRRGPASAVAPRGRSTCLGADPPWEW